MIRDHCGRRPAHWRVPLGKATHGNEEDRKTSGVPSSSSRRCHHLTNPVRVLDCLTAVALARAHEAPSPTAHQACIAHREPNSLHRRQTTLFVVSDAARVLCPIEAHSYRLPLLFTDFGGARLCIFKNFAPEGIERRVAVEHEHQNWLCD